MTGPRVPIPADTTALRKRMQQDSTSWQNTINDAGWNGQIQGRNDKGDYLLDPGSPFTAPANAASASFRSRGDSLQALVALLKQAAQSKLTNQAAPADATAAFPRGR